MATNIEMNILNSNNTYTTLYPKTQSLIVSYDNSTTKMSATNTQSAIDELFISVSNGKSQLASAITDKGVSTSVNDSFNIMASNIGKIEWKNKDSAPTLIENAYNSWINTSYTLTNNTFKITLPTTYSKVVNSTITNMSLDLKDILSIELFSSRNSNAHGNNTKYYITGFVILKPFSSSPVLFISTFSWGNYTGWQNDTNSHNSSITVNNRILSCNFGSLVLSSDSFSNLVIYLDN